MATESQINDILAHPFDREWSIQGFGMLRTYLDDDHVERLHIWDANMAVEDVSTIHDHPWDFTSRVVRGRMNNERFTIDDDDWLGQEFLSAKIRCGVGGGLLTQPVRTRLSSAETEIYWPDQLYSMEAPELHESFPSKGAVTVITREFKADRDTATVCWRAGGWVSAEPRPATRGEIEHFIALASRAAR